MVLTKISMLFLLFSLKLVLWLEKKLKNTFCNFGLRRTQRNFRGATDLVGIWRPDRPRGQFSQS